MATVIAYVTVSTCTTGSIKRTDAGTSGSTSSTSCSVFGLMTR
jgi:hypothetical protein